MSGEEIQILVRKVETLLKYCDELRSENNILMQKNEEQESQIKALEERIAHFEDEGEQVRTRVSDLIEKIDQIAAEPEAGETEMAATQTVIPSGV